MSMQQCLSVAMEAKRRTCASAGASLAGCSCGAAGAAIASGNLPAVAGWPLPVVGRLRDSCSSFLHA